MVFTARRAGGPRVHGFLRTQLRWTGRYDRLPPPIALQARLAGGPSLDSGVVGTLTRNRLRRPRWDVAREALSVAPEEARFEVPKAYVRWQRGAVDLVVGTYRMGFAQRLTFDVTGQVTPNGMIGDFELRRTNALTVRCARGAGERLDSPCPEGRVARVTPDFAWTNRLTGIGLGLERALAGSGRVEAYVWGSYQMHRALRTEVALGAECRDPRRSEDPGCDAPTVLVRRAGASLAGRISIPIQTPPTSVIRAGCSTA